MAQSAKEIKSRISSVENTGKITKAMEMISTIKMKRAQDSTLKTRIYTEKSLELIAKISAGFTRKVDLLEDRENIKNILVIIIGANKGLCGGYNINVIKKMINIHEHQLEKDPEVQTHYLTIGKKVRQAVVKLGYNLDSDYTDFIGEEFDLSSISKITDYVTEGFREQKFDSVKIIYNHFVNTINQIPLRKKILPMSEDGLLKYLEEIEVIKDKKQYQEIKEKLTGQEYDYEPGEEAILKELLPKLVEVQIYQALLDARASEHSSRMMAMKNASDNAEECVNDLVLKFNKARQASITQEIGEIVSGMEAMV